ncbi:MAG: glycosyltransferase [Cyclobacteriaceae bacterium]|jgi:glycosyltransferase involved in cell wall biosynthesis|nr:glycosyltransferase [Cyclobacteriaceae bacterium]
MANPLVTVICLCHNQAAYLVEAIHSVLQQTYQPIQLIVVDDASKDGSVEAIQKLRQRSDFLFLPLPQNIGNCRAFNQALAHARGEFIIDLAADDILLPERIERGITAFEQQPAAGVQFSDALLVDEKGAPIGRHTERIRVAQIPQGDIYRSLIDQYFICSPTLMTRKQVFDELGGYDEMLAYEDFDFLIRAARAHTFVYLPEVLVHKRLHSAQLSRGQKQWRSRQHRSTFRVCEKILELNQTPAERQALARRIRYELKHTLARLHISLAYQYVRLWFRNRKSS